MIHILYPFHEGAWGGGNQFLKALRHIFEERGWYTDNPARADIILFNSFPFGTLCDFVTAARLRQEGKVLIHRVDGPISLVRGKDRYADECLFEWNGLCAHGTVFQSRWSLEQSLRLGMDPAEPTTIIMNAPDPSLFFPAPDAPLPPGRKPRLIATSWSKNKRKGFEVYEFLDNHLDFSRYDMTFVGNSPIRFQRIQHIEAVASDGVAALLRNHDIYITASEADPCSNSLIEALHCGLPAVALNDGGHPEIVGTAGVLFEGTRDILSAIDRVAGNLSFYRRNITLPPLEAVAQMYYDFFVMVRERGIPHQDKGILFRAFILAARAWGYQKHSLLWSRFFDHR